MCPLEIRYSHGDGVSGGVVDHNQRPEEVVPGVDEGEDDDGRHGSFSQRDDYRGEYAIPVGAIDESGFLERRRYSLEELFEDEDADGHCQPRKHRSRKRIDESKRIELLVQRDDQHLEGDHHAGHDCPEEDFLSPELDLGKGIGDRCIYNQGQDHG